MAVNVPSKYKMNTRSNMPEFLRQKNENRLGMTIAAIAISFLIIVVGINSISMFQKNAKYAAIEKELMLQIEEENKRTDELNNFKSYSQTKKYVEEVAKDKLGLVYENEILFQEID